MGKGCVGAEKEMRPLWKGLETRSNLLLSQVVMWTCRSFWRTEGYPKWLKMAARPTLHTAFPASMSAESPELCTAHPPSLSSTQQISTACNPCVVFFSVRYVPCHTCFDGLKFKTNWGMWNTVFWKLLCGGPGLPQWEPMSIKAWHEHGTF